MQQLCSDTYALMKKKMTETQASMRLYLANKDTETILFKPIRLNIQVNHHTNKVSTSEFRPFFLDFNFFCGNIIQRKTVQLSMLQRQSKSLFYFSYKSKSYTHES